jgi:PAS domain S-box-containing protein
MPAHHLNRALAIGHGAKWVRLVLTLLGLAAVMFADTIPGGPLAKLRNWVFDTYERSWPPTRSGHETIVIDIDGDSLHRVGQWPWPRDQLARLLEAAAGARVIGLDLLLTEPDRLAGAGQATDASLAASLRRVPSVLAEIANDAEASGQPRITVTTPVFEVGGDPRRALPHFRSGEWPLSALAGAASGGGLITVPPEADGVMRRMPTVASVGPLLVPSFGIEIVRVASGADQIRLRADPAVGCAIEIGERVIRTDQAGNVWPRYAAGVPSVPAHRVLNGTVDRTIFRDRVVLIGASAPGLGEVFLTPLGRPQSGVFVQAQFVESLLAGDQLWRPAMAPLAERLLASLFAIVAMLRFGRMPDRAYALWLIAASIFVVAGSFVAFAALNLLLDWTLPLSALVVVNLLLLATRTREEAQARRRQESELATARREAELRAETDKVRESLSIALDAAQMGIWDTDLIRGTSHRSPRHDQIFGYSGPPPEWGRESLLSRVVDEDREAVGRSFDEAMENGVLHFRCRIRRPDGSLRSVAVNGRVYHNDDGSPVRIAGVVADVTDRRRIEEALNQAQKLHTVGTIAGGVAHNFNNLLTIVLGNLDLASRECSGRDRLDRFLTAAARAAERGADLTRQLLAFARRQALRPKPINLSEQLRDFSTLLGGSFDEKIRIETDIPSDLWTVEIDPAELQFALFNLGLNARDAMPDGGVLKISAANRTIYDDPHLGLAGGYVAIEIADNGPGIRPDILARVFEPFVTTKEVGASAGLGLSQVHGFVHQSGGAVDIESEPGAGTVVRMYLPAAPNLAMTEPSLMAPAEPGRATGTVLIVEDQPDLADLAGELFRQWQLDTKVVHRASAVLDILQAGQKIDLVFSDIMMPDGMDGLELAEVMKKRYPGIPILLTSGYSEMTAQAVSKGFQIISKPYRMEELGMRFRAMLGLQPL